VGWQVTFDPDAVGAALRRIGRDLSNALPPVDLGKGKWRVETCSRVKREALGSATVRLSGKRWTVDGVEERTGRGGDVDVFRSGGK